MNLNPLESLIFTLTTFPELAVTLSGLRAMLLMISFLLSYPNPVTGELEPIINAHPIVRVHPATGWKALFVNSRYTIGIKGFEQSEAQAILQKLFQVYEQNPDTQVRFRWTPRSSALWE